QASLHQPVTRESHRPVFAQPRPTEDPTKFLVHHASDAQAYAAIDELNKQGKLQALRFQAPRGGVEPQLTIAQVLRDLDTSPKDVRDTTRRVISRIQRSGQIVFHSLGDCGSTRGPSSQNLVVDKLLGDFKEHDPREIPQFHFLLGDIVYSFGEAQYYYDQF